MATFNWTIAYEYTFDSGQNLWIRAAIPVEANPAIQLTGEDDDNDFTLGESLLLGPQGQTEYPYQGTVTFNGVKFVFADGPSGSFLYADNSVLPTAGTDDFPESFAQSEIDTADYIYCFAQGTLIATPEGEVAVEDLAPGQRVLTVDGRAVPVVFVGWQEVGARGPVARNRSLVCIAAGALGGGLPRRDLTVTGDHAMMIDGVLYTAAALVNGAGIRFLSDHEAGLVSRVYHVETAAHEVLLAEGAPSESFIDYAGRKRFANYADYLSLHGADRLIREMEAPRVTVARMVPAGLRTRLDAASGGNAAAGMALAG